MQKEIIKEITQEVNDYRISESKKRNRYLSPDEAYKEWMNKFYDSFMENRLNKLSENFHSTKKGDSIYKTDLLKLSNNYDKGFKAELQCKNKTSGAIFNGLKHAQKACEIKNLNCYLRRNKVWVEVAYMEDFPSNDYLNSKGILEIITVDEIPEPVVMIKKGSSIKHIKTRSYKTSEITGRVINYIPGADKTNSNRYRKYDEFLKSRASKNKEIFWVNCKGKKPYIFGSTLRRRTKALKIKNLNILVKNHKLYVETL